MRQLRKLESGGAGDEAVGCGALLGRRYRRIALGTAAGPEGVVEILVE